ncbi:MAG: hypothetical protein ABIP20_18455 [Chthoniobacteraceae bacterium]
MPQPQIVSGISNREFIHTYAAPGRIGLAGGADAVSRLIQHLQRGLDDERQSSLWSHAFLFQGQRHDGHHWVFESDLEVHRKNIRLGVQENRVEKFCCEKSYPVLAVLDFGLGGEETSAILRESLDMVAGRTRYSLRELMGTLIALRRPAMRAKPNPLARPQSLFCSAFVTHVLRKVGMDPVPGLDVKHAAPEDLFRSPHAASIWLLQPPQAAKAPLKERIAARIRKRLGR